MNSRKRIVVGVNNSAGALEAAQWAAHLADNVGAELLLASAVVDPGARYYDPDLTLMNLPAFIENLRHDAETAVQQIREKIQAAFPALSIDTVQCSGSADVALVQLSGQAWLTVVGTQVDSASGRTVVGPTTLGVADHAHGPVAVWRRPPATERADAPIVVGVDATPSGSAAVGFAFELASALRAPLTAVHTWRDGGQEQAERTLAECLAGMSSRFPDVVVRRIVQEGVPAVALQQQSTDARALVVASRVRNGVLARLLGSTSQNLLHHTTVPLIIHRG